jgi:hypothetical protein
MIFAAKGAYNSTQEFSPGEPPSKTDRPEEGEARVDNSHGKACKLSPERRRGEYRRDSLTALGL